MKTESLRLKRGRALTVAVLLAMAGVLTDVAVGQQPPTYSYPPEYAAPPSYPQYPGTSRYAEPPDAYEPEFVPPHQFFRMFGRRFGEMFRGLFYGDELPPGYDRSVPGGRSLDTAPPSYGSHYGPSTGLNIPPPYDQAYPPRYETAPRYSTPPPDYQTPRYEPPQYQTPPRQPRTAASTPPTSLPEPKKTAPSTKAQSAPPKKYVPPTITRTTPGQAKVETTPPPSLPADPKPEAEKKTASSTPTTTAKTPETKPSNASAGNSGSFLKGKRTGKAGRVTSPYPPYQELDVTGLASGSLALDPTTQKVFEVP